MITRERLTTYLDTYLEVDMYQDYAPNGLQIEGKKNIERICTAVSASLEVIQQAYQQKADALLVHHGYFWRGEAQELRGMKRQRIAHLLQHNMNLFAFHLPLDCHLEIGNNACIGRLLNVQNIQSHRQGKTRNLLWSGQFDEAHTPEAFTDLLKTTFSHSPIHIDCNNKPLIKRIAWCSGAAQDFIDDAVLLGADAYISGEISERTYYQAREQNIHYFACGHHATERYGIQALGVQLARQFGVSHHFIDVSNPI